MADLAVVFPFHGFASADSYNVRLIHRISVVHFDDPNRSRTRTDADGICARLGRRLNRLAAWVSRSVANRPALVPTRQTFTATPDPPTELRPWFRTESHSMKQARPPAIDSCWHRQTTLGTSSGRSREQLAERESCASAFKIGVVGAVSH